MIVTDYERKPDFTKIKVMRKDKPEEGIITLIFKDYPFRLAQFNIQNNVGEETSIYFSNLRYEKTLPEKLFQAHLIREPQRR